jgi:2-dehydro-3-deoxyphosphogluconate aldolase/(4S)-4-hydroxy-2-oxoglutarate aldolase
MHGDLHNKLHKAPYLPTVFPVDVNGLCQFAQLLHDEGYPAIEVLARPEDDLLDVFYQINQRPERLLLQWGVGTVKTAATARKVLELKPDFVVSPAFSRRVLEACAQAKVPYMPAVQTFQDVQNVVEAFDDLGLDLQLLKLCPVYGLTSEYVQSMAKCFPGIRFCPTGEITMENYCYWKKLPEIVTPMGSRMVPRELMQAGDFTAIRKRLRLLRDLAEMHQ